MGRVGANAADGTKSKVPGLAHESAAQNCESVAESRPHNDTVPAQDPFVSFDPFNLSSSQEFCTVASCIQELTLCTVVACIKVFRPGVVKLCFREACIRAAFVWHL
jgi:hypothetical protein